MNSEQLIEELRRTWASVDKEGFIDLCNEHAEDILQYFPGWLKVPEPLRGDPAAVEAWVQPLFVLAEVFERAGCPQLMERMTGGADNPISRWQRSAASAERLVEGGQLAEAIRRLETVLGELHGASGTAVDELRPKVLGLLGIAYFKNGDAARGRELTQMALHECGRVGDLEGIRIYTSNLRVISGTCDDDGAPAAPSEGSAGIAGIIAEAQELSDEGDFTRSNEVLLDALAGAGGEQAMGEFRGKVFGLLGLNHYRQGAMPEALQCTEQALDYCTRAGDHHGITIYTANLETIRKKQ